MKRLSPKRRARVASVLLVVCCLALAAPLVSPGLASADVSAPANVQPQLTPTPSTGPAMPIWSLGGPDGLPTAEGVALAEVATVRVVAHYNPTPPATVQIYCTGLGMLVQSTTPTGSGTTYLLTSSEVLAKSWPCFEQLAINTPSAPLVDVSLYLNSAWKDGATGKPLQLTLLQGLTDPALPDATPNPQPVLIALAPSVHDYATVAVVAAEPDTATALDLYDSFGKRGVIDQDLIGNPGYAAQFLTPVASSGPVSTANLKASDGAPLINAQGQVVGLGFPSGLLVVLTTLNTPADDAASCPHGSANCLTRRWKQAMDLFYSSNRAAAKTLLTQLVATYPDFQAAQTFLKAANVTPAPTPTATSTPARSSGLFEQATLAQMLLLIGLGVLGVSGLIFLCVLLLHRARQRNKRAVEERQAASVLGNASSWAPDDDPLQARSSFPPSPKATPPPSTAPAPTPLATWQGAVTQQDQFATQSPGEARPACPTCGAHLLPGSRFCNRCGAALPTTLAQTVPGTQLISAPWSTPGPLGEQISILPRDRRGHLLPGAELQHQRYRIERVIAAGGMGAVYQATDRHLKQTCAIKEMLERFHHEKDRRQAIEWFEREAQVLLKLHHPAIPRIYDRFAQDDQHYLVMDFIVGRTLEDVLTQDGQPNGLPEARVRGWATQLCDVLAYLHGHEPEPVIFRDLKPPNIMVTPGDQIKLIDFGIARIFHEGTGTLVMTPGYAPLEQLRGKAEPRSDLYALGALLHYLLTLQKPSLIEFLPLRRWRPEVSLQLEAVIEKALQDDPAARWASARAMGEALQAMPD